MKKQELVESKGTELATVNMSDWGDVVVESKDFIMPKVLLQQAMSDAVKERTANDGDYLNTLTGTVCSDAKGEVNVLPFFCKQSYTIEKWNGKKFEYFKNVACVPGDAQKPFEEEVDGTRYRNMHLYEFFCLLEDGGTPAIVPFKSTSHKSGKKLFNLMYVQNRQQGKVPAHNWITLGRFQDSNKDGDKYFVMDIAIGKEAKQEDLAQCMTWIKTIKQTAYQVAEEKTNAAPVTETRF